MTSHGGSTTYTHIRHVHHSMPETIEHRILRSRKAAAAVRRGPSEPEADTELEEQRCAGKSAALSPLHRMGVKASPTSPKVSLVVDPYDWFFS
jgi:hypothetical protein